MAKNSRACGSPMDRFNQLNNCHDNVLKSSALSTIVFSVFVDRLLWLLFREVINPVHIKIYNNFRLLKSY